jgi:hypothetical protein
MVTRSYSRRKYNNTNKLTKLSLVGGYSMSEIGVIKIGDIDERFLPYIEINEEKQRIESYKCPVSGCPYKTNAGPGAIRMHTILAQGKSLMKDESGEYTWMQGFDNQAHIDYFKENKVLTLEDIRELARTDTRAYSERDI